MEVRTSNTLVSAGRLYGGGVEFNWRAERGTALVGCRAFLAAGTHSSWVGEEYMSAHITSTVQWEGAQKKRASIHSHPCPPHIHTHSGVSTDNARTERGAPWRNRCKRIGERFHRDRDTDASPFCSTAIPGMA